MRDLYTFKNLGRVGRLGNQLWQIAGTIGQATQNGGTAYIRPSWRYKRFFSVPENYFVKPNVKNKVIDGGTEYFQDLGYWKNISNLIHDYFQPSNFAIERLFDLNTDFQIIDDVSLTTCAVHVRRGDYLEHPDLFPFTGVNYYANAFDKIEESESDVLYVVFSDDIKWCRETFVNAFPTRNFMFVDGVSTPVEVADRPKVPSDQFDLFLMSLCDYHIISNSTFSWWGAWLSRNSEVLFPSRWYGPGLDHIDWRLMIPDSWIEVEV